MRLMMLTYPPKVLAGDVIRSSHHNMIIDLLTGFFDFTHVEGYSQPFQVSKHNILLLMVEGSSTIGFPNSVHVFLSGDNVIFEEVAGCDFPYDGELHISSLTVPIPKDYYVYWTAPYGFVKSAVLF